MLWLEAPARLAIIVPTVAVPIVSWLGVGSLISVLHPVSVQPLFRRWRRRRDRGRTAGWLFARALPYALYYVADPMGGVEHRVLWSDVPRLIWPIFGRDTKSFVHLGTAVGVWLAGNGAAVLWVGKRGAVPMRNWISMASRHAREFGVRRTAVECRSSGFNSRWGGHLIDRTGRGVRLGEVSQTNRLGVEQVAQRVRLKWTQA